MIGDVIRRDKRSRMQERDKSACKSEIKVLTQQIEAVES